MSWYQHQSRGWDVSPGFSIPPPALVQSIGCPRSWCSAQILGDTFSWISLCAPITGFLLCMQMSAHTQSVVLDFSGNGPEVSGVFGDLDPSPPANVHNVTSFISLHFPMFCFSSRATARLVVPGKCCSTFVWPLLQPHSVFSHSIFRNSWRHSWAQNNSSGTQCPHDLVWFPHALPAQSSRHRHLLCASH